MTLPGITQTQSRDEDLGARGFVLGAGVISWESGCSLLGSAQGNGTPCCWNPLGVEHRPPRWPTHPQRELGPHPSGA